MEMANGSSLLDHVTVKASIREKAEQKSLQNERNIKNLKKKLKKGPGSKTGFRARIF